MRKNLLKMLTCGRAAILTCGLTVTLLSACSSDNDPKTETPQEQADVQMMYAVEVTDDVLKVADVEVNYVDQTGAKQKEVMTSTTWKKTLNAKTLPLTEGLWAKLTPKGAVASGDYFVKVTTSATYEAKLANGQTITGGFGTDPAASLSLVQTPERVAAWCATSPTVGFAVDKDGYAAKTSVDFGGNSNDDGNVVNVSPDAQQGLPALDFTDPVFGQVIGSDGKNYDYASLPSGVTAVAKICYVSGAHGLALALTDESGTMDWSKAQTTCAAHQPAFNGGTWKLASKDEWSAMMNAARSVYSLRDRFSEIGASNLQTGSYWSSTESEYDSSEAWYYDFSDYGLWDFISKAVPVIRVRACLAF